MVNARTTLKLYRDITACAPCLKKKLNKMNEAEERGRGRGKDRGSIEGERERERESIEGYWRGYDSLPGLSVPLLGVVRVEALGLCEAFKESSSVFQFPPI